MFDETNAAQVIEKPPEPVETTYTVQATVGRADFAQAVALASLVIERKHTIPILSNALLTADGEALALVGTDLDMEIKVKVPGAIDSRFDVTVPAHILDKAAKGAKACDQVNLSYTVTATQGPPVITHDEGFPVEVEGPVIESVSRLTADFAGAKYGLEMRDARDFPIFAAPGTPKGEGDEAPESWTFMLPTADLVRALERTKTAMSQEEVRYYLNGVYMHFTGGPGDTLTGWGNRLRFVATDGHRLMAYGVGALVPTNLPGVIIPRKAVLTVLKIISALKKAAPERVTVKLSETKIRFTIGHVTLTTKAVDGCYPDYHRVIPRDNDKPADFKAAALAEAVSQVMLMSEEKGRAVKFGFTTGFCELTVHHPENGSANTRIDAHYQAEALEIGFNSTYVQSFIAQMSGTHIRFEFADAGGPALVRDPADSAFVGVLMPRRV